MTARTGDVIEQARAVIAKTLVPPGVAIADAVAQSLHDAGMLRQEPPTRDEIARAMEEKHRVEPLGDADHHHGCVCGGWDDSWDCVETWDEHYADAVLALLEGRKR